VRHERNRRRLRVDAVLADMYVLAEQHADQQHGHSAEVLRAMSSYAGGVMASLKALEARGWAQESAENEWSLTPAGLSEAQRQRGWAEPGESGGHAAGGEGE
jgi:hypothetical protein